MASKLGVNPVWLMGYDVPIREDGFEMPGTFADVLELEDVLTDTEAALIRCWRQNIAFILRDYGMPFPKATPETKESLSNGA